MKRIAAIILVVLSAAVGLQAQELRIQNRPYLDQRFLHYGFFVGLNMMDIEFKNNGYVDPASGEQWYTDVDNFQPGFTVGVLGELRLSKYLGLRIQPTIYFGQKHLSMHEQVSGRDTTQNLKSTYISVPVLLKVAAPRHNNFRPYVVAGAAPSVDLTTKKHNAILTDRFDCFVELGMGCDIYLPFFKLIPELRFSFGLRDIFVHDRRDLIDESLLKFSNGIDSGHAKMVSLVFDFE